MRFRHAMTVGLMRSDLAAAQWKRLAATAKTLEEAPSSRRARSASLRRADCLLVNLGETVDAAVLKGAPNLRYIGVFGTGYDGVDVARASKRGITVTNVPGYATDAVAEFTMAAALVELRCLRGSLGRSAKAATVPPGRELKDRTVGVVGLGRIGRRVAEIALGGFGARVSYWSRTRRPEAEDEGIAYAALEEVLRRAEVLSVNLPFGPSTEGILDARRIARIRRGAAVICFAPLGVFDTVALASRLEEGDFALAIDDAESLSKTLLGRLKSLENVTIYPPVGNTTVEATRRRREAFVANLEAYVGGRPINIVGEKAPQAGKSGP